jgi:hypothetical protein
MNSLLSKNIWKAERERSDDEHPEESLLISFFFSNPHFGGVFFLQ